ncbi:DUF6247 family protein [Streptomyces sp. NPDC051909]|uniref:DUF6247 family protein n=1 Tax=Streptomyces sp. NPDC051909 TaxID=3154944 RepID=UPI0034498BE5
MTASAPDQPLIPQPPSTVAALRQAVAQIAPAALPAFTRELDQAADQARLGSDLGPLRRFISHWAVYVQIQRQPLVAARFRELESQVAAGDANEVREAAGRLGQILDEAREALSGTGGE